MIKFAIVLFNPTTSLPPRRSASSAVPITPYLRHGSFIGRVPGNKLPGYLHAVPRDKYSQRLSTNSTQHHHTDKFLEDEDDDEDQDDNKPVTRLTRLYLHKA